MSVQALFPTFKNKITLNSPVCLGVVGKQLFFSVFYPDKPARYSLVNQRGFRSVIITTNNLQGVSQFYRKTVTCRSVIANFMKRLNAVQHQTGRHFEHLM